MVRIAIDAMGGDLGAKAMVKGAVESLKEEGMKLLLFGEEEVLKQELSSYSYDPERIEIVPCSENISIHESPVMAIRRKKDSSLVRGMLAVKNEEADAFISAGSTGAVLAGGQLVVGREKGVYRPPLAALIPTKNGVCLLTDCGANVDAKPEWLHQFAKMGAIYMEEMLQIKNPSIGLVNIGAEEEKGNALVKETMPLLKECKDINFIGSIEAREIPKGGADVIVCEAFVGNVIIKLYEGVGSTLIGKIKEALTKNMFTKIGAMMIKSSLKATLKSFDASGYGGAPLLGLNGLVVKAHGNSKANEICNSILQCKSFKEEALSDIIREKMIKN